MRGDPSAQRICIRIPSSSSRRWFAEAGRPGSRCPRRSCSRPATADGAPSARRRAPQGRRRRAASSSSRATRAARAASSTANPQAALLFLWPGRQVRIEGTVERIAAGGVGRATSDSRPFGSRVSAVGRRRRARSSRTGRRSRRACAALRAEYAGREDELPRPAGLGRLPRSRPPRSSSGSTGDDRLHDRLPLPPRRRTSGWIVERLAPLRRSRTSKKPRPVLRPRWPASAISTSRAGGPMRGSPSAASSASDACTWMSIPIRSRSAQGPIGQFDAEAHRLVEILRRHVRLVEHAHAVVQERDEDPVDDEARRVVAADRLLAERAPRTRTPPRTTSSDRRAPCGRPRRAGGSAPD